ncbi:MAG: hypothetical protein EHM24_32840 [Acidobacteria bacterium]|nr:MAG: hypothetical protein EHM24_32840 [Acidobacteriota bacterium]
MRLLLILALLLPAPVAAQSPLGPPTPPITDGTIRLAEDDPIYSIAVKPQALVDQELDHKRHRREQRFWLGAVLVATGAAMVVVSLTTARQSDLSREDPAARLNVHLAPCRTDPGSTPLAIADCKPHYGLLATGSVIAGAGGMLMLLNARDPRPALGWRVRF